MLNTVNLIGRFTRDPELRATQNGIGICSFTLAVGRNYAKEGEERKTDFINCAAWRHTAEFISGYFKKGSLIAVEGNIQTRKWENESGETRYATEVIVERAHFVEKKKKPEDRTEELKLPDEDVTEYSEDDMPEDFSFPVYS